MLNINLRITAGFEKIYECQGFENFRRPYYDTTRIILEILYTLNSDTFIFAHYFDTHIPYIYGFEKNIFKNEKYQTIKLKKGLKSSTKYISGG